MNKFKILLVSSILLVAIVACTTSDKRGARVVSFRAEPLVINEGETVTVSWEVEGTGPLKVLLRNVDVSDKTSMTFTPTTDISYFLDVEGPYNKTTRLWRKVTVIKAE